MPRFDCVITDRHGPDDLTIRRFEFPGGLLPSARAIRTIVEKIPELNAPVTYPSSQARSPARI